MFEVMGMSYREFLRSLDSLSTEQINEAIEESEEQEFLLNYDSGGRPTFELMEVREFIHILELELEERTLRDSMPEMAQIWAYGQQHGFVSMGKEIYPFVTTEQCKAIVEMLHLKNKKLENVQLIGRGLNRGVLGTYDVQNVLRTLS